ncbi:hypothetical protein NDU88_011269 [Pleurodeles waltl]|uniref:Secreted protein n=1 Tax=Pleurodeles waltl TaxID=8319 RepID=A0AAV7PXQ1_PLEWA|nr:hypothetical protein NDU88_011269 [Pleurodeles waltl]
MLRPPACAPAVTCLAQHWTVTRALGAMWRGRPVPGLCLLYVPPGHVIARSLCVGSRDPECPGHCRKPTVLLCYSLLMKRTDAVLTSLVVS